jgi:hypothetical protein
MGMGQKGKNKGDLDKDVFSELENKSCFLKPSLI